MSRNPLLTLDVTELRGPHFPTTARCGLISGARPQHTGALHSARDVTALSARDLIMPNLAAVRQLLAPNADRVYGPKLEAAGRLLIPPSC